MKRNLIKILRGISQVIPLSFYQKLSRQRLFLPFYHVIDNEACLHIDQLYQVQDTQQFEQSLDYLLRQFKAISLDELVQINRSGKRPQKPVFHLSFDDGLRQCSEVILPILERKGISATFFINSKFLDNQALMYRYKVSLLINQLKQFAAQKRTQICQKYRLDPENYRQDLLQIEYDELVHEELYLDDLANDLDLDFKAFLMDYQPYMNQSQVQKLLDHGHSIGSHSIDHPKYFNLELKQQLEQTLASQAFLEGVFDLKQTVFAFPFTDFGVKKTFFEQLFKQHPFQLTFGGAGLKNDSHPKHLQRFPMESAQYISAQKMLSAEYLYYLLKAPLGKNRIQR